jgi:hypothetical protein
LIASYETALPLRKRKLSAFLIRRRRHVGNDQFTGILRAVVPAVVAYLVGKGWVPAETASDIGAGVITILAAIWSWKTNTPGKTIN